MIFNHHQNQIPSMLQKRLFAAAEKRRQETLAAIREQCNPEQSRRYVRATAWIAVLFLVAIRRTSATLYGMAEGLVRKEVQDWRAGSVAVVAVPREKFHLPKMSQASALVAVAREKIRVWTKKIPNPIPPGNRATRALVMLGLVACLVLAAAAIKTSLHLSFVKLPTLSEHSTGIEVYDRNDKLVTVIQKDGDRKPVPLAKISPHMRHAVIAIEDHNFYNHCGVDPLGIARAMYKNAQAGHFVEGGSTITQQLMKTMHFGHDDRTARRKILEMFMALDVETCYSKDKILETYLNEVYYGRGAYGIEQAASAYFNKRAGKLNIPESAYLAALIKAPSDLGRVSAFKRAKARQSEVIDGMVECGFISKETASQAKAAKLAFRPGPHFRRHPYYVNHILAILKSDLGENNLWSNPMKVYTYLDSSAQVAAELALAKGVRKAPSGVNQGAVVSIDLNTGGILALVGGVGQFEQHQFNRALNPHTAGSAFKPFVYLTGLINGAINPNSILNDAPIAIPNGDGTTYSPENYDEQFDGPMTVRDALALSRNIPAVKVGQEAGINNVIDTAHKAGISAQMDPYPSLALGTCAVTPLEMANAYATIARGGEYVEPQFIRRVEKLDGNLIKEFQPVRETRLPEQPTYQLVDVMEDVVRVGTGRRAQIPGVAVAGKTGTADGSKDVWFVGFTPDVVTAVWAGSDANDPIHARGITGGTIAAGIWSQYMGSYYRSHPKPTIAFTDPEEPLANSVPYFAFVPQSIMHGIGRIVGPGVVDYTNAFVEREVIEPLTREEVAAVHQTERRPEKKGKSFFKRLAHSIKSLF